MYMYKVESALNNSQGLKCHKTNQPNQTFSYFFMAHLENKGYQSVNSFI